MEFKDKEVQLEYDMLEMDLDILEDDLRKVKKIMQKIIDKNEQE